jgi:hypothetical protein
MKKILLLLVGAVLISSCTPEEDATQVKKDCGCNRIVEVSSFYMPDRSVFGTFVTINDCTGVQRNYQWQNNKPQKGSCY